MSLLRELINGASLFHLGRCRSLCGIPNTTTRKQDIADALLLQAQCPRKHRAMLQYLAETMTMNAFRSWISSLRHAGFMVPPAKVMNRGRAEIIDAIVRLDHPASAGEYSPAARAGCVLEKERAGEYSPAHEAPGDHGADSSAGMPAGSHDVGMVLVAYDASSNPERIKRKLRKTWMKLAQRASMRSQLPGRVRRAVAEALQEHPDPDTTVLTLRAVVENKVGVNLTGKYGVLFDKALLRQAAKPITQRRFRQRFVLVVSRRHAKKVSAS